MANKLIDETSPYLQQHAHNPVDWYAWGAEALDKARAEDKPILLSIGYSACHWCHVMEHESFENEAIAGVMNELFVSIKVDREERPDLDKIYQLAHQMLSQRPGGWPLTVFLTPDTHVPFFAGTYFPNEARHGLPAFPDLLRQVATWFRQNREQLKQQEDAIRENFKRMEPDTPAGDNIHKPAIFRKALQQLESQYDSVYGGFGDAPKFPHPTNLQFLLHYSQHPGVGASALEMARFTLHAMASGGIYDQLGGGFCRYSTDEHWMIPHFEKMLYDNAQLLPIYADAWLATNDAAFQRVAEQTGAWVIREMQSPDGGYYSTLDADSEGEEGKYYVFTTEEMQSLLSDDEWAVVKIRYTLRGKPNFEHRACHLHIFASDNEVAQKTGFSQQQVHALLARAHEKQCAYREQRIRPGRDEKILTSWNGMMIAGMAHTGRLLGREDFIESATRALEFMAKTMYRNGRLFATHKDGKTHLNAYLDDYVLTIDGILELLQARWNSDHLQLAIALADAVLEHFEDREHGGFYFTSDDHEVLLHRHKPGGDDATPSGNGIAAQVLQKLGHLLGESRYLEATGRCLRWLFPAAANYPSAYGSFLVAREDDIHPGQIIVLRGNAGNTAPWQAAVSKKFAPQQWCYSIPSDAENLTGSLAQQSALDKVTAYICSGTQCSAPMTNRDEFIRKISEIGLD